MGGKCLGRQQADSHGAIHRDANEGFKIEVLYNLDIPVLRNYGIDIDIGKATEIVVVTTLVNTTEKVKTRFEPTDRKCYFDDEVELLHVTPKDGFK